MRYKAIADGFLQGRRIYKGEEFDDKAGLVSRWFKAMERVEPAPEKPKVKEAAQGPPDTGKTAESREPARRKKSARKS